MGTQEAGDIGTNISCTPFFFFFAEVPCCPVVDINCIRTEIRVYSGFENQPMEPGSWQFSQEIVN